METKIIQVDKENFNSKELSPAIELLLSGEIVGFPTETVYGLGGSINHPNSIRKIFEAKLRPMDNPLIVHISNYNMLEELILKFPKNVEKLCKALWPGPLTILFEKSSKVPKEVTAGLPTVAIRMPSHPIALKLIEQAGVPIVAPSANLSGRPSPTTAEHVYYDLHGKIPLIIDGGKSDVGIESTVVDLFHHPPLILRPGGVNFEILSKYIPDLQIYGKNITAHEIEEQPSTPGMKYQHYAPTAFLILVDKNPPDMKKTVENLWEKYNIRHKKIGLIHVHPSINYSNIMRSNENLLILNLGESEITLKGEEINKKMIAHELFASLRDLDQQKVDIIIVEGISEKNEGLAIMNRLRKAASEIII